MPNIAKHDRDEAQPFAISGPPESMTGLSNILHAARHCDVCRSTPQRLRPGKLSLTLAAAQAVYPSPWRRLNQRRMSLVTISIQIS